MKVVDVLFYCKYFYIMGFYIRRCNVKMCIKMLGSFIKFFYIVLNIYVFIEVIMLRIYCFLMGNYVFYVDII